MCVASPATSRERISRTESGVVRTDLALVLDVTVSI
jgi:hypothetical protein